VIRVLIADDHALIRRGVCSLLEEQADIEVVGEAKDGDEAVDLAQRSSPDIVIMDVEMPHDGLAATRAIKEAALETRVLVLTIHEEAEFVDELLKAGADGYLLKKEYADGLVEAIRLVHKGEMALGRHVGQSLVGRLANTMSSNRGRPLLEGLSHREVEVLTLVTRGLTNREIGKALGVSERTVKGYVGRLLEKFGVDTRTSLAHVAMSEGLVDSPEA